MPATIFVKFAAKDIPTAAVAAWERTAAAEHLRVDMTAMGTPIESPDLPAVAPLDARLPR